MCSGLLPQTVTWTPRLSSNKEQTVAMAPSPMMEIFGSEEEKGAADSRFWSIMVRGPGSGVRGRWIGRLNNNRRRSRGDVGL